MNTSRQPPLPQEEGWGEGEKREYIPLSALEGEGEKVREALDEVYSTEPSDLDPVLAQAQLTSLDLFEPMG